jgi:hypothetical protein
MCSSCNDSLLQCCAAAATALGRSESYAVVQVLLLLWYEPLLCLLLAYCSCAAMARKSVQAKSTYVSTSGQRCTLQRMIGFCTASHP